MEMDNCIIKNNYGLTLFYSDQGLMATTNLTTFNFQQRQKLWLAAIKPPMYSVAIIPITVGTAIAFGETQSFNAKIFWTFLSAAILIIAWLNLSNDVFDAETGIDKNKAHSVVNLTGNKSLVFLISNICLGLGLLCIILINYWLQDWTVLWLIMGCCGLGYSYQGPPFRLGYLGLGEIICFVTFGPMAISAVYYSQTQQFSSLAIAVSVIIGITTSIILFCSHFHQIEDDLAAGKKSPLVRLGTKAGSIVLAYSVVSIFLLTLFFVVIGMLSSWTLLIFASFPFAYQLITYVNQHHDQPDKVSNCKFIAVNLHFMSGILLAIGLIINNLIT
jgi:1,4-dihydroxy-2-naphthoate octaprenyltransferase